MVAGVSVVVPTLGRPSLVGLLRALARALPAPMPFELLLVDDRRGNTGPLPVPPPLSPYTRVLTGRGAGPAAARNLGWRAAHHDWLAFLDDDVQPAPGWFADLTLDLARPPDVGGVQGGVWVPLPAHRRPTDWERQTAGLATAAWITADMAYRRSALVAAGGFDERFGRAYREDAELAHRVSAAGWRLVQGHRRVAHPVRPAGRWVSLRAQRGNADDALLRRLYGRHWRQLLQIPAGRRPAHAAATAAGAATVALAIGAVFAAGPIRAVIATAAAATGAGWLATTGEFALARIRGGPRDPAEVAALLLTSAAIPPLATVHWLRGWWRHRGARPVRFAPVGIGNHSSRARHAL
jgi:cellulose synthase/poly-beta-1,6-N-acetylglucosamine synthase-like glycosyltransferase